LSFVRVCDMSGDVWVWCENHRHGGYTGAPAGGQAWVDSPRGSFRVFRGGCWIFSGGSCRTARRSSYGPSSMSGSIGLRLAKS
jgi:sulfatase modifying factor 1